jgi:hypothetical protein
LVVLLEAFPEPNPVRFCPEDGDLSLSLTVSAPETGPLCNPDFSLSELMLDEALLAESGSASGTNFEWAPLSVSVAVTIA